MPLPAAVTISNSTIVAQLSDEINRALRAFHVHSKTCRPCRNPVAAYQEGRDLCEAGRDLSVAITKLLYKKAEHLPNGTFAVEYKHGWTAVDGLIRIICHYNQGKYTTEVVDLKRCRVPSMSAPAVDDYAAVPRGSMYEEDLRRRHRARTFSPHRPASNHSSVYGDPRVSYVDAPTARTQGYGPTPPDAGSPSSSSRSVHFDSRVRVREFQP